MKNIILSFIISALIIPSSVLYSRIVSGIEIPETLKSNSTQLILNGAGVREKFFMDLYVGALYLKKKDKVAKAIINSKEDMAIRLYITSSLITSKKMRNAVNEGFENSTNNNTAPIKKEIGEFTSVFKDEIKDGDIFEMIYTDSLGTSIIKNGVPSALIKGHRFKEALFGIWLCEEPAQKSLKEDMLGE
ncbi:MAG: chalcone isomerase family protein [Candidatus Delongbacteria bacterium]|nr:chalcone isomerase family protein [Candidatus Delongbacteria bacterium]